MVKVVEENGCWNRASDDLGGIHYDQSRGGSLGSEPLPLFIGHSNFIKNDRMLHAALHKLDNFQILANATLTNRWDDIGNVCRLPLLNLVMKGLLSWCCIMQCFFLSRPEAAPLKK